MRNRKVILTGLLLMSMTAMVGVRGPLVPAGSILVLDLGGDVPETYPWNPLAALISEQPVTVLDKLVVLKRAAVDKRIKGVLVRLSPVEYSLAKAQEFRQAIVRFKQNSGKPVRAYLEMEGSGNLEYYIASACDKVYVSPASSFELIGLSSFRFYLGGLWEKIYVDMQVDQIREYKSAADMLARKSMSDAEREVTNSILDSLYTQFVNDIAQGRGVEPDEVRKWIDLGWLVLDNYIEAGAVDGKGYTDEIARQMGGGGRGRSTVTDREYLEYTGRGVSAGRGPNVAVIFASGSIVSGEAPTGPFARGNVIASNPMVEKLQKAMEDDSIEAVIFRIDSGGGSALASDLIWQATQQVKTRKPLVVSMSDVAGSGGYYIACGADSIVAQPGTITGSIGILTAHISIGKLLKKIGVGTDGLGRGRFSEMGRPDQRLSEQEFDRIHDRMASLYDLFITRVGAGRSMSKEAVNEVGRGRIWTGLQASELGLVDRVGGFEEAEAEVRRLLGLSQDEGLELVYGHEQVTLWKILTGKVESSVIERVLSPEERGLIELFRFQGLYREGQPLAIMPEPVRVR